MPAPNTATLYDFESAYEDALRNYFLNVNIGGQVFAQVITPRTNLVTAEFLQTPRLLIRASVLGLGSTGSGSQWTEVTVNNVVQNYWSDYQLGLELTVCTARNNASQNHGVLRGGVRVGMTQAVLSMNNNTVPYYQTWEVIPTTSTQGIDPENDEINTQMQWAANIFIPPASFPNS